MKTKIFFLSIIAMVIAFAGTAQQSKTYLSEDKIPAQIKTYVTQHFPKQKIVYAQKEQEFSKTEYEIKLDNLTELEFNGKYQVTDIDGKSKLPDTVVPEKILSYVKSHYPGNSVVQWNLKRTKQEIELDNDLELDFSLKGEFLRVDD